MGSNLYQQVKISCESSWTSQQDADGNTLRSWKVTLAAVDDGKEVPGKLQAMLDHVEYILHPTFFNPRREVKDEPYLLKEEGWGEFDLRIMLHFADDFAPREIIVFDLNFREPKYSKTHVVTFSDVSAEVASYLESLKDIGKESSHRDAKKKLPTLQNDQDNNNNQHRLSNDHNYSDDELSLPAASTSPLSPAPPALSPASDLSIPQQDFDQISPVSESHNLNGMMENEVNHQHNGHHRRQDLLDRDKDDEDNVEDEVLTASDIEHLNTIHYRNHDDATCRAWDIPEQFNMVELARRLSLLSDTQADKLYALVQKHQTGSMAVDQKNDQLTMDLYSLGAPLLTLIWKFTEKIYGNEMDED
ncbi:yeats family-domain-containing protein [Absidia repens]|uniref:Yeats family-domain-containing protein n=1 Tax=Absidia repens TaxID=90262 RepID=A0A1X2IHB7_9FUNG|nr:yeats family-domain-containing protein [Absidia repens]